MITYYLNVEIRSLIGHASESNKVFEINEPKCERGKIFLIMALLYTGSFQKTKTSDGKNLDEILKSTSKFEMKESC